MIKNLLLVLSFLIGIILNCNASLLYEYRKGPDGTFSAIVLGNDDTSTQLVIPDFTTYQGQQCPVVGIEDNAFQLQDFGSITLGANLRWIGSNAFQHAGVTKLVIPPSITYVYGNGLPDCSELIIEDGNDQIRIDKQRFEVKTLFLGRNMSCEPLQFRHLSSLSIGENVTEIYKNTFDGAKELTYVKLPEKLEKIGEAAFYETSISTIDIPPTVNKIESFAFGLTKLNTIRFNGTELSERLTIDADAFYNVSFSAAYINRKLNVDGKMFEASRNSLQTIEFGKYTEYIEGMLCNHCTRLTNIKFAPGIKEIKSQSFWGCEGLTNVTLPDGLEIIGIMAFADCSQLSRVELPATVKTFSGDRQFVGCSSLKEIICHATTPPMTEWNAGYMPFDEETYSTASLWVPEGSVDAYSKAEIWKDFMHIAGAEKVAVSNIIFTIKDGRIVSASGNDFKVDIISANGILIYSGLIFNSPTLAKGLYLVRTCENGTRKIIIN